MKWTGVPDSNFCTVFCLKGWKSCTAVLHDLVTFSFSCHKVSLTELGCDEKKRLLHTFKWTYSLSSRC